jgi:ABC-type transport system involved in multi-copper enzyme maturation permease subunit
MSHSFEKISGDSMKTIIYKEIKEYIQSLQFVVLLAFAVVLFSINGIVSVKKYQEMRTVYTRGITDVRQNPSTIDTHVHIAPNPLLFTCNGGADHRPPGYKLQPGGQIAALPSGPRNYRMPLIPNLDWSFLIKVIFSLYVVLLAFQAVSGEKEQGTLRLMLSNPLGRIPLLMSKWISIVITTGIPLLLGCIISLIITSIMIPEVLTASSLLRILLMFFLSLVCLSVFTFLSLAVSSLISRSSLVLLVTLVFWILFAIVIPNTSGILAREFASVPSEYQTASQVEPMIQKEVWERVQKILGRVGQGDFKTIEEVRAETDRAFETGQEKVRQHYEGYNRAMRARDRMARNLSRISPTALFQYASENLTGTGPGFEAFFLERVRRYSNLFDGYIHEKMGKVVGTSYYQFSTSVELNGQHYMIESPRPKEYEGDKSDFPFFRQPGFPLARGLRNALLDLGGLVLWNLVLAFLAFSAFQKMDVR